MSSTPDRSTTRRQDLAARGAACRSAGRSARRSSSSIGSAPEAAAGRARSLVDRELDRPRRELRQAIEYVPTWVVVGVALCLGIGTTIGYKRIVVTVAEKIGKTHLTYAQGASAEVVAMATIGLADVAGLPVSTTQVLSSGVAGTMWANRSGIQMTTIRKIGLAWILTFPAAMLLAAGLYLFGHLRGRPLIKVSSRSLLTTKLHVGGDG